MTRRCKPSASRRAGAHAAPPRAKKPISDRASLSRARRLIDPGPILARCAASAPARTGPGTPAQHAAGRSAGGLTVLERQLPIDEDIAHASRVLHGLGEGRVILEGIG